MRFDPPPRPQNLYERRLAWRALSLVLERYELAGIALKLNPDDPPSQVFLLPDGQVLLAEDLEGRWRAEEAGAVVRVDLKREQARVVIRQLHRLIRRQHLAEFDEVWTGGASGVDADIEVDLSEVIALDGELLRTAPPRVPAERLRPHRSWRSLRAVGRF